MPTYIFRIIKHTNVLRPSCIEHCDKNAKLTYLLRQLYANTDRKTSNCLSVSLVLFILLVIFDVIGEGGTDSVQGQCIYAFVCPDRAEAHRV